MSAHVHRLGGIGVSCAAARRRWVGCEERRLCRVRVLVMLLCLSSHEHGIYLLTPAQLLALSFEVTGQCHSLTRGTVHFARRFTDRIGASVHAVPRRESEALFRDLILFPCLH